MRRHTAGQDRQYLGLTIILQHRMAAPKGRDKQKVKTIIRVQFRLEVESVRACALDGCKFP